ncbi:hypothetical protein NDU88_005359 [Pleurodeles waltl]|uniref:Uncharacterized protein n=1 Tax=Pleurodeles waltl TaxID=8319 RepID=A0AAV7TA92_PLEWA|nr:hypothetical protein NDU88_005359 [Pleurodeles waltl]
MTKDKRPLGPKQSTVDQYPHSSGAARVAESWGQPVVHPNTATLLAAITQSRDMLDAKIRVVGSDFNFLRQDLRNAVERLTEAETRVLGVEDSVQNLLRKPQGLEVLTKDLAVTQSKLAYQNTSIMIVPDYTKVVQQQRMTFTKANQRLRDLYIICCCTQPG